jgi:hypothetical protein
MGGCRPRASEEAAKLSAFGEPLTILLAALRRIATNIVGDAFEEKDVGRFANADRSTRGAVIFEKWDGVLRRLAQ